MRKNPTMRITEVLNQSSQEQSVTLESKVTNTVGITNIRLSKSIGQYGYISCEFDAYDY